MIELNSLVVILTLEALIGLLGLVIWLLYSARKISNKNFTAAEQLIENLDQSEAARIQKLSTLITQNSALAEHELKALLQDIALHEKALYRTVVQAILGQDPLALYELDEYIFALAKPYCKLLQIESSAPQSEVAQHDGLDNAGTLNNQAMELQFAQKEIVRLADENTELITQLQAALKAADEISEEYSRVFNGKQEEDELRASAQRMLAIFSEALDNAKAQSTISLIDESDV